MNYQQHKAALGRNPWIKLKVYKPGTWLSRGGFITVRGAEQEIRSELEYVAARELQAKAENLVRTLEGFFAKAQLPGDSIRIVIE